jgi:hypothetical protein
VTPGTSFDAQESRLNHHAAHPMNV